MTTQATYPGAVLWDLDGTLIDSAPHHWLAWREVLEAEGRPVTPQQFAASFGKRNDEILIELFGAQITPEWIKKFSDTKEQTYRRFVRERGLTFLPGAESWLSRLKSCGWRQALASSAPHANIEAASAALGLTCYLDAVVSADDVGRGKPDPAVFLEAARRLGVSPSRCVVVEDAPAGIEAAHRAGMQSIGVLSPHHTELAADVVVASLDLLPATAFADLLGQS